MSFIFASLFQSSAGRHNQNTNSASQPSTAVVTEENPNDRADDDHHNNNKHDGHNNNSSSDDLLQYVDTVQPPPPPPPPPPRYFASRNPKGNRNVGRSLSKLFTTYHPPSHAIADDDDDDGDNTPIPPPSYSQMMMDLMEYIMSIILLELNMSKAIHQHYHDLMTLISQVKTTTTTTTTTNNLTPPDQFLSFLLFPSSSSSTTPPQHRFANRMSLTAFACDIFQLCPSLGPHNETTSTSALELPPEGWMELKLRLNNLKEQLLSIHANDDPVKLFSSTTTTTTELPGVVSNHPVMMMDEQLSNHIMMTTDFDTVMTLLSVQQILASFREQLEDIKEELQEEENGDNHYSPHMNQLVETCVSSFMKSCSELFPPPIVADSNKNDENDDDDEEDDDDYLVGEESEHTKMTSNQTGATTLRGDTLGSIPHELVSLALMELYSPKQQSPQPGDHHHHHHHHHQGKNNSMIDRLLDDIQSMILDGRTTKTANDTTSTSRTTMNHDGRFSYANLVDKVGFVSKWMVQHLCSC